MAATSRSAPPVLCSVCRRPVSITAAGLVRVHGPVRSRCPGSRCAPLTPCSDTAPAPSRSWVGAWNRPLENLFLGLTYSNASLLPSKEAMQLRFWVPRQPLLGTLSLTISDFVIIILFLFLLFYYYYYYYY